MQKLTRSSSRPVQQHQRAHPQKTNAATGISGYIERLRTPGHRRTVLLRRGLAGVLVCAAAILAVQSRTSDPEVVVFLRPVAAGSMITIDDVGLREQPAEFTPAGAFAAPEDVMGTVAVSAAEPGEVVTPSRFISSELTAALVHSDNAAEAAGDHSSEKLEAAHMVPISLADPEIIPLLNHGDTVSVISEGNDDEPHAPDSADVAPAPDSTVIAEGARVIMAREATSAGNRATVMLALPSSAAQRVAVASLTTPLTVVLTGERATGKSET